MLAVPAEIVSGRLVLRESDPAFADAFASAMAASTESLTYVSDWREAADVAVAARSLTRSRELAGTDVVRHAFTRDTGEYVARIDLHSWDFDVPRCEIGYIGNARLAGRGLVREAALLMVQLAWSLGVERIQAKVDTRNTRAADFALTLGLHHEGVLARYERDDEGRLCDQFMLAAVRP